MYVYIDKLQFYSSKGGKLSVPHPFTYIYIYIYINKYTYKTYMSTKVRLPFTFCRYNTHTTGALYPTPHSPHHQNKKVRLPFTFCRYNTHTTGALYPTPHSPRIINNKSSQHFNQQNKKSTSFLSFTRTTPTPSNHLHFQHRTFNQHFFSQLFF